MWQHKAIEPCGYVATPWTQSHVDIVCDAYGLRGPCEAIKTFMRSSRYVQGHRASRDLDCLQAGLGRPLVALDGP